MELNLYSECEVEFLDEYQKIAEDVLSHVLQRYACPFPVQVSLYIVTPDEIKEANAQTRQIDKVTDVLSFPMFESIEELEDACANMDEEGQNVPLGDVVICMDKVIEKAEQFGHSRERETVYLFTHSILHLLGYDHETEEDKAEMRQREEEIMEELGLGREETQSSREETEIQ